MLEKPRGDDDARGIYERFARGAVRWRALQGHAHGESSAINGTPEGGRRRNAMASPLEEIIHKHQRHGGGRGGRAVGGRGHPPEASGAATPPGAVGRHTNRERSAIGAPRALRWSRARSWQLRMADVSTSADIRSPAPTCTGRTSGKPAEYGAILSTGIGSPTTPCQAKPRAKQFSCPGALGEFAYVLQLSIIGSRGSVRVKPHIVFDAQHLMLRAPIPRSAHKRALRRASARTW